jgi:ABC-type transport system involved in multi-copper enzyme maturation permease subunit
MVVVLRRLLWEHRVRLPLLVVLVTAWGFLLVTVYAESDAQTRTAGLTGNAAAALRILGLDPLAAWVALGQTHPIFLVATLTFAVGLTVRAIAGELEAGTLELQLARPVSRLRYLAAHVVLLVPGCLLLTCAYAAGTVAADRALQPPGRTLLVGRMLVAAGESALLVLAVGAVALLVSALASERGRALAWALGIAIVMYAGNFLFSLWSPLRPLARLTLFWYFTPGPAIQQGRVSWADSGVLAAVAVAALAAAAWRFARRDIS